MRKTLTIIILLCVCSCAVTPTYETVFVPNESESSWVLACHMGEGGVGSFVTYVPKGSTCADNDQMLAISVHDMPVIPESLGVYLKKRKAWVSSQECQELSIIEKTNQHIIWETVSGECSDNPSSYSITKILLGNEAIHLIEYSSEKYLSTGEKAHWTEAIEKAYVEKNYQRVYPGKT